MFYDGVLKYPLFVSMVVSLTGVFSFDTNKAVILHGFKEPGSYFGYSVAVGFNKATKKHVVLVGAPQSEDPTLPDVERPGVLFACTLPAINNCIKVELIGADMESELTKSFYKKSWLGGSVATSTSGSVVTCAHKSYDWKGDNLEGACYGFPLDSIPEPMVTKYTGMVNPDYRKEKHSIGISVHYTETTLMIGTAGFPLFSGGFVCTDTTPFSFRPHAWHMEHNYFALTGYSQTSGKYFADGETYYAFGAPRAQLKGKIVFFKSKGLCEVENSTIVLDGLENGSQESLYYSYYGATLCTVDVNNDNIDDLLVGAPLYTPLINNTFTNDIELGIVFVYLGSDRMMGFQTAPQTLKGFHPQGRFGSSIARLGDVNSDNFDDIAIGAPYENNFKGAVYIFNGYSGGVWPRYSKRILSTDLNSGLRGFGISISSGQDVNSDEMTDMVVGAYLSDQAVVLFGQLQLSLDAKLKVLSKTGSSTHLIELDKDNDESVNVCFTFNDSRCLFIDLNVTITLDVEKGDLARLTFAANKEAKVATTLRVERSLQTCASEKILKRTTNDLTSQIGIGADYAIYDSNCSGFSVSATIRKFHASYPLDHIFQLRENFQFRKDCPGNICKTDLSLTAVAIYNNISDLSLPEKPELAVDVTITKVGDAAYGTVFETVYPKHFKFVNIKHSLEDIKISCDLADSNHTRITYHEAAVTCSLGNLLLNVTDVRFQMVFKLTMVSVVELRMLVTTLSTDLNLLDNNITLPIDLQRNPGAIFNAFSTPNLLMINGVKTKYDIKTIYEVHNNEGFLLSATINISYPQIQTADQALLFLNQTKISCEETCAADCSVIQDYRTPIVYSYFRGHLVSQTKKPITSLSDIQNTDCTKELCSLLTCTLRNIQPTTIAYVYMEFEVVKEIETILKEGQLLELISVASLEMSPGKILKKQVSTKLRRMMMSPNKKQQVSIWIILISGLGGIFLLSLIILVLWKGGFFRRPLRDEFRKKMAVIPHSGKVTGQKPRHGTGQVSGKHVTNVGQVTGRTPIAASGQVSGKHVTNDLGQVPGRTPISAAGQVSGKHVTNDAGQVTGRRPTTATGQVSGTSTTVNVARRKKQVNN